MKTVDDRQFSKQKKTNSEKNERETEMKMFIFHTELLILFSLALNFISMEPREEKKMKRRMNKKTQVM